MTAPIQLRAQLPAWSAQMRHPHRYKVSYGGRGASRSWTFARMLLIRAATAPIRVLCTRELQTSIKDSVHKLLDDQIKLMGLAGFTVLDREIRHANGSLFLFEGLRYNINKIKSFEGIDVCWVEEAERVPKDSWDALIPTIRKEGSEIWVTFNPDEEADNTYQRFIKVPPRDALVMCVTWKDNPWFPRVLQLEKDYAYATDPDGADHVWGGSTRKINAAQILKGKWLIEEFTPVMAHTAPEDCADLREKRACSHAWDGPYQGMDFGYSSDPFASLRCWIHKRRLYVERELYRLGLELDHIVPAVEHAVPDFAKYVTRADSSRPDSISYLRRHGFARILGAVKGKGSVEDGIAHLRSYDMIVIHPRCTHTADEAKHYSYKVDERSGDILPDIVDAFNHCIDALRYALEPMMKQQRKVGVLFPATPRAPATHG